MNGDTRKYTPDDLVREAIKWWEQRVEKVQKQETVDSSNIVIKGKKIAKKAVGKLPTTTKKGIQPHSEKIAPRAYETATEYLGKGFGDINSNSEIADLVNHICDGWKQKNDCKDFKMSKELASNWLKGEEKLSFSLIEVEPICLGIAAAAAVLALILKVREGHAVKLPALGSTELRPTEEFTALREIADNTGECSSLARKLIATTNEPWNWSIKSALKSAQELENDEDKRLLLRTFEKNGVGKVTIIRPDRGVDFHRKSMSPISQVTTEDFWVVSKKTPVEKAGYSVDGQPVLKAEVEVCTFDWWVLSAHDCPVGRIIDENSENLIAGGRKGASGWRAPWGFSHPEDLRDRLRIDEEILETWRNRISKVLNERYSDRSDRCLTITGNIGEKFEASTMESPDATPLGDAVVVEVLERNGVPQQGLACPGGSPLLLAVVNTKPAE